MPNIDRDDENATRYEMPKPDIDEQIARQKHVIDLHEAGLLESTPSAQQAYDTAKAILATLKAYKRIIEAAEVPEPVGYVVHTFIGEQKARWYTPLNGGAKLYGDNLLDAYHKALAELTQMYRSFEGHVYVKNEEYSSLVQRAETTERQLAEINKAAEDEAGHEIGLWPIGAVAAVSRLKSQLAELREKHDRLVMRLREPSEEMTRAGVGVGNEQASHSQHCDEVFVAMSTVALRDSERGE